MNPAFSLLLALCTAGALAQPLRAAEISPAAKAAQRGQALLAEGQAAAARDLLSAALAKKTEPAGAPGVIEARVTLGRALRQLGDRAREQALWSQFFDEHDAGALNLKDPTALRGLAIAARYLGSYQDANDTFRDGVEQARLRKDKAALLRLNTEWAALFLEKYAAGYAEQSLDEALAQDPEDAEARVLMARVRLEQGNDVAAANRDLDRALARHPGHGGALALRAHILIEGEQYAEALQVLRGVIGKNAEDREARALVAAAHLLRDDDAAFQAEKQEVLRRWPGDTTLHRTVAEALTREHRYDEAVALLEEAVRLAPKDAYALSALGSGYLRQGEDQKGLEALQRAWRGDKFNVRTFNLLNLFEKIIPKDYTTVTVDLEPERGRGGLRLRLPLAEKELLLPLLVPFVQAEWRELVARYQFRPKLPLTLELYENPEHYAVRTVGLPGLAALGVTFGQVVTGRSPAQGAFNWGLMVWHELSHVFAIQASRSRVPRWFTEGLSEWETEHHDADWTRRTHGELYGALAAGTLLSVGDLNGGFTRARSLNQIVVAYHESAELMGFLVQRFGFPKVLQALRLFGAGKAGQRHTEVLSQVTGLSVAELDRAFQAHLREHLKAYEGHLVLRPSEYENLEDLEQALKARPEDPRLLALHALGLLKRGDAQKALAEAQRALKRDPGQLEALIAEAEAVLRGKDEAGAEQRFRALIAKKDSYDARLRLGQILAKRGAEAQAEAEFAAAKRLDPDRNDPYLELAKLREKLKRGEETITRELVAAAHLDVMDGALALQAVKRLHGAKQWEQVVQVGAMARFLAPYDGELRGRVGEALLMLGRRREARAELDAAIAALPTAQDEEEAAGLKARRAALEALRQRAR